MCDERSIKDRMKPASMMMWDVLESNSSNDICGFNKTRYIFTSRGRLKIFNSEMKNWIYALSQLAHNLRENRLPYVLSVNFTPPPPTNQPSPSSNEDDLLSFPLIVIIHIWSDRSAGWWRNTRSHLPSKCCQGQVDSRGRSWRVLVSPLSPSIIATPAHDSLRVWAGKIILPIIHIDLMAAAAKWMLLLARRRINHRGQTQNDHIFCFWSYESDLNRNKDEEGQEGWRGTFP